MIRRVLPAVTGRAVCAPLLAAAVVAGTVTGAALPAAADPTGAVTLPAHSPVTAETALRLSGGSVWYADTSSGSTVGYTRPVDVSTTPVGYGTERATPAIGSLLVAGSGRVAWAEPSNAVLDIADAATFAVSRRVTLPTGVTAAKLSGPRLQIDTATGTAVTDLVSGRAWSLPANTGLSGRYAAWINADGSISRRDLLTGAQQTLRGTQQPEWCTHPTTGCTPANSHTAVKVHQDWVLWKYDCEVIAERLAPNGTVLDRADLTHLLPSGCIKNYQLLDGLVVFKDPASSTVQAATLVPAPTSTTAVTTNAVTSYTANDHAVAWTEADNTVHVAALPVSYAPRDWLLGADTAPAFSPNGDGRQDTWAPEFDANRATQWSLALVNAAGSTVRTLTGTAGTGAVRPVWNGATDAGTAAADGVYRWVLSGTAVDSGSALAGSDGAGAELSGTVVVKRSAPAVRVSAPPLSTTSGTGTSVRVSWAPLAVPSWPGYRVTGYDVTLTDNGVARTLATNTAATATTIAGAQGHTYRVAVRSRDTAGNIGSYSTPARTAVPFDDRNSALGYSAGWTAGTAAGTFLGTVHLAGAGGAAVSLRTATNGINVVATRCTTCGRVRVYLDGVYQTTVDTYATTTQLRAVVWAKVLGYGTHTLRLVVVAVSGRRLALDGVAALR